LDFFISYNKADGDWAEWIAWQLEESGYSANIQAWDFRPGSNFVLDMQRAAIEAERSVPASSNRLWRIMPRSRSKWKCSKKELPTMTIRQCFKYISLSLLAAVVPVSAQIYNFDPTGSTRTFALSVNTTGAVTGYYFDSSGLSHGFVRNPQGHITPFDPSGSVLTYALSINTSGAITGFYTDADDHNHGFVRDPQGNITPFDPSGSVLTYAWSINTSGAITGYSQDGDSISEVHGFVRDPQGDITLFDALPGDQIETLPTCINAAGAITGYYNDASFVEHGFVRDPQGTITLFDPSGSTGTFPEGINTSGAITGYYIDASGTHSFVRDLQGHITSFDPTGSTVTTPSGINTSGAITGSYIDASGDAHGFVRDPQGYITSFYPTGSTGSVGINTSGAVTGSYSDGVYHGFVGTAPNGMDISRSAASVPTSSWQSAIASGVSNVMVQAWGGRSKNQYANAQLSGAQSNGLNTGAYILLTYFSNQSAEYQVAQAIQAIGTTAMANLKVIVIDVETCCGEFVSWKASTKYVKGAQIMDPAKHIQKVITAGTSGSAQPAWNDVGGTTPDPVGGSLVWQDSGNVVVSQANRIAYISNAISYVNTNYPALKVVIYTDGPKGNWQTITGNCDTGTANNCTALINLPLWDVVHKTFTAGDGTQHCGDGVAGLVPWKPWSSTTWQTRNGNQYDWGLYTTTAQALEENADPEAKPTKDCTSGPFFGLSDVDLDYFNPVLFQ
jgi:hypothetical protein